jgi:hypothetical protein
MLNPQAPTPTARGLRKLPQYIVIVGQTSSRHSITERPHGVQRAAQQLAPLCLQGRTGQLQIVVDTRQCVAASVCWLCCNVVIHMILLHMTLLLSNSYTLAALPAAAAAGQEPVASLLLL